MYVCDSMQCVRRLSDSYSMVTVHLCLLIFVCLSSICSMHVLVVRRFFMELTTQEMATHRHLLPP